MARLFTNDPENITRVSIPIQKTEKQDDGSVLIWGKATDASLDRDQQIIDPDFARKSLRHWFETGANVRVMHSSNLYPAGRGVELVSADDGEWLKSRIVEPTAIKLVNEGVLQAYSVGIARPMVARDAVAKMGRVVGGETVEVSLVDRPANPSCGVMLAKGAGGDDPQLEFTSELLGEYDQALTKAVTVEIEGQRYTPRDLADALTKIGKARGVAVPRISDEDIAAVGGVQVKPGEIAEVTLVDPPVAKGADHDVEIGLQHLKDAVRQLIADQGRDVDAPIHPADHVVSADLAELAADTDRALADQHTDMAQDKQLGHKAAQPDLAKVEHLDLTDGRPTVAPADGVPYGLRRLHDATCAAYGWASVKDAHPGLEKSSFAELLTSAPTLLYQQLASALAADAGTGGAAEKVADLAGAYQAATTIGAPGDMDLAQARSDLHRAFKAANPAAPTLTPFNTGGSGSTPSPGQWRRPYLSAGRAPMSSTGQRPRIPNPTHVVRPEQFQRGLIEAGHEADSPGNTGSSRPATPSRTVPHVESTRAPGEKGAEVELIKTSDLLDAMADLHDHLAGVFPHMCSMDDSRYAPRTNTDLDNQPPANLASMDMNADSAPTPVYAAATPDLLKTASPDLLKAAVAELVTEQVETRLASQAERYETDIAKMRVQLDELAAQPDPNQSAFRGMAGLEQILPQLTKRASEEPPAGAKAAQVERLGRWLDSPDPAQREAARASILQLIQQ